MSHQNNLILLIFRKLEQAKNKKNTSDTTAQFDQLTISSSETSFDDLQQDYTPVKQEPAVEVEPLEFNFSFEKTAATENTSQPVHEPEVSTPQQVLEVSSSQEANELADLEFSFDLAPLHESEEKKPDSSSTSSSREHQCFGFLILN